MTKTNTKAKKFKKAGLVALVAASGMAVACGTYNQHTKSYDTQSEQTTRELSVEELKREIKVCDRVLERLQKKMDSRDTDEELFYVRREFRSVTEQRADLVKRLEAKKAHRGKTIHLYDAEKAR